ncbi:acetoacetate--CoA ligase [Modestobacter sp. I12A-02628]|uniref:Acetoacetate--CoA ligase n=1 Tax=Goekera deserti TaxID=2497753 RepID=A0A7K3W9M8_9ACTN|nr:acetoacetate--CoA ligase [Goekera deserti]MPQ98855.1 acetoacetate--CoA ligase [Goekera deserti]NDI49646.1 acetoacetate--CoA ligase [Goekera deserti]NEL53161.1 acetoacetate--CoA ligase [Goekera deserti]
MAPDTAQPAVPDVLWSPTPESIAASELGRFAAWVAGRRGLDLGDPVDYDAVWRWSTEHLDQFWADVATWFEVFIDVSDDEVLTRREMPGAVWFPDRTINLAEHALRPALTDSPALIAVAEDVEPVEISWAQLRGQVGAFAATLRRLGVRRGDRVAGYLPNVPEAVVAFLGCATIGAVWSSCAPDFGTRSVLDRFVQIEPVVLVAVDGYRFNGRAHDRRDVVAELRAALPSVRTTIAVPRLAGDPLPDVLPWAEAVADEQEPAFEQLPFDHPLWIVYSSGTTGLPKGIVHGHGGMVLEQHKQQGLHLDVGPGDRFSWYASTAWIMWNIAACTLLRGATVVVYDGAPAYPALDAQFALAARTRLTYLGTSAGYLTACEKAGLRPGETHDLAALRTIGSTGSPLPASAFRWVYEAVKPDVLLGSLSGGTDIATGFVGSSPLLEVVAGELQRPMLGVAAASWDSDGRPVVGELGELVVTGPMPTMPLYFWNDPDGARYADAYFQPWPGVWRHGDWLEITESGTCLITGRSDSTLNRGGVRMGTADIYAAVEAMPAIADCVVLGVEQRDGGYWMPLFVQLAPGAELTEDLVAEIEAAVRANASPRHVPDEVIVVPGVPHTRTGKRLEVPLKRLFQGVPPEKALNLGAVDDATVVEHYVQLARERGPR